MNDRKRGRCRAISLSRAGRPVTALLLMLSLCASGGLVREVLAQTENPVYVDDSPQARELFRQAQDQSRNNAGEAVRLYQELLDEFPLKLIPVSDNAPEHYKAVRVRVLESLKSEPALLERYRLIQTPEAQKLLEAGEFIRLALTRSLTQPGLDALLTLAQRDLEAGRFYSALAWLNQGLDHADLSGKRAAHCRFMIGMASHYVEDADTAQASIEALQQLGTEGEAFRAQLEKIAADNQRPAFVPSITTLDRPQVSELGDLVAQAIWSVPLTDSLLHRKLAATEGDSPLPAALIEQRSQDAALTTAVATVVGPIVYINEGTTVLALNRLTGRQLWPYNDLNKLPLSDRPDSQDALDLNVIAVSGDSLVTLTGHAGTQNRSNDGKVICLDATTGSFRWGASFEGLVEAAGEESLFPHGAPIIADGTVFVEARKISPQLLTSAYVVAIDLASGHPRWARHITSSGGLRPTPRPISTLVYDKGSLYVATAVGATARLDAVNGEIRWLRRFNVPISGGIMDIGRRPWEMTGPVVTSRGVLLVQPDQRRVVLLDTDTGDQLESHSAASGADWNMPRYLLADRDNVYAVGTEIRAFRIENLEHPIWRLPAAEVSGVRSQLTDRESEREPKESAGTAIEIRGRVQQVEGALIVPTSEGVLVVSSDVGAVQRTLAVQAVGNPLAVDAQLLLATGDRLDAYMSFNRAEQMLRERIAQAADEPEPALSLMRLGMRVNNLRLALESAGLAMQAIDRLGAANPADPRNADTRDELFALLLEMGNSKIAATPAEGESLFATIGSAAVTLEQRVEHLLAYGDWLADHSIAKAVESYQTILSDRKLAESWRDEEGTTRPAWAWAGVRMAALMEQRGPAMYAPQADFAEVQLKQINLAPEINPDELVALAQEFPFSNAAIDAALQAAALQSKRGNPRAALAALTTVHHAAPRKQTVTRLLSAYVQTAEQAGWIAQARTALESIVTEYGDLSLNTATGERSAKAWLALLFAPAMQEGRPPHIGQPSGESQLITGALIGPYAQFANPGSAALAVGMPPDRVLIRDGARLQLLTAGTLDPKWTATIEGDLPQLLRFDDSIIIIATGVDSPDPRVTSIDAQTGAVKWVTPKLSDLLGDPVRDLSRTRGIRDQMPDGEPFNPIQTLALLSDKSLIMVQRTGGIVAFDLADARTPRWVKKQSLEQVHQAALIEGALVLAGALREASTAAVGGGADLTPRIFALDPQTGQSLWSADRADTLQPIGRAGVKWMKISPLGVLVYGAAEGLDAIDLLAGRRLWTTTAYDALDTQRVWLFDHRLVVEDQRGRLRAVSLQDGSVSEPFETAVRGEWEPQDLRGMVPIGGRIAANFTQRVVIHDPPVTLLAGADVISDERDYRWLLPVEGGEIRLLVLSNIKTEQKELPDQSGRRVPQYTYRVYLMSDNCKALGAPLQLPPLGDRVQQAQAINGWLLLSTQTQTLAVPMAGK